MAEIYPIILIYPLEKLTGQRREERQPTKLLQKILYIGGRGLSPKDQSGFKFIKKIVDFLLL